MLIGHIDYLSQIGPWLNIFLIYRIWSTLMIPNCLIFTNLILNYVGKLSNQMAWITNNHRSLKSWKKYKSEDRASTDLRIHQWWDQWPRRSKHPLSSDHTQLNICGAVLLKKKKKTFQDFFFYINTCDGDISYCGPSRK
jgi:hypothetical protein